MISHSHNDDDGNDNDDDDQDEDNDDKQYIRFHLRYLTNALLTSRAGDIVGPEILPVSRWNIAWPV